MGKAIIFCAPSGAGKTTIVKHLINKIPSLKFSISATTRPPRKNETDKVDYYFLSPEDFTERRLNNELYEWEEVYAGTFYGTLKSEVNRIWSEGNHVIFDVDVQGGLTLKKSLGSKALSIFVSVDDISVLKDRLMTRNTDSDESIEQRVSKASQEMEFANSFDYVLVNRELDLALQEAEGVVKRFLE